MTKMRAYFGKLQNPTHWVLTVFITFLKTSVGNYVSKRACQIFAREEIFVKATPSKLLSVLTVNTWWILKELFHAHR